MGKRNPHQECIPERNTKSKKWISVLPGWILLLEKEPLTYMGDESTLYNMEMKKTSLWKKYDFVDIILKESIRFRADNKRAVLEKIELL